MHVTSGGGMLIGFIPILMLLVYALLIGLGIYLLLLLIQLAKRGVELLDLQIAEKRRARRDDMNRDDPGGNDVQ
ncbi:hypothetical protein [Paenibacillus guangzhouensis]|uniref:hypothetical protein n=1 Tax=Paenibacillus guangzhouensis TaxID=1473112 RepID=UPI001267267B|nr:hypothetical protein [Paenibacillus guangzhouensis]